MSTIKSNGTKIYAIVNGAVVPFTCYNAIDLGQDSFGKIDISCLDEESKRYRRGSTDPGEGSLTIQLDDESDSHAELMQLVDSGETVPWYIGSNESTDLPTIEEVTGDVTLPTTRNWVTFEGYLNNASPTIEQDGVWTYAYPLVRSVGTTTILRTT